MEEYLLPSMTNWRGSWVVGRGWKSWVVGVGVGKSRGYEESRGYKKN